MYIVWKYVAFSAICLLTIIQYKMLRNIRGVHQIHFKAPIVCIKMISFVFVIILLVSNVKSSPEDEAMLEDASRQLSAIVSKSKVALNSEKALEEMIMETVNIAFAIGCDAYEQLIKGKFITYICFKFFNFRFPHFVVF